MGFAEQAALLQDVAFKGAVTMAAVATARKIAQEPAHDDVGDPWAAGYWSHRHSLVTQMLNYPEVNAEKFAWALLSEGITLSATDAELAAAVEAAWDEISGAATQLSPEQAAAAQAKQEALNGTSARTGAVATSTA